MEVLYFISKTPGGLELQLRGGAALTRALPTAVTLPAG